MNTVTRMALLLAWLAVAAMWASTALARPAFVRIDLGTLGGNESSALALTPDGQVIGNSSTADGGSHAFSWTEADGMIDIGPPDCAYSWAEAVSSSGQVIGMSSCAGSFSWTKAGGLLNLGVFGMSEAFGVNSGGQIVGIRFLPGGYHASSWTDVNGVEDLGTLGGSNSGAYAVNDAGQVMGSSETADGGLHAFFWTRAGGMVDVGTLGSTYSYPWALSSTGQVVGESYPADGVGPHAFSWNPGSGIADLGTLGGSWSWALAVNSNGQVVGSSETSRGPTHAFSWTRTGGIVDVGTLGGPSSDAFAVSSAGQVVGNSDTLVMCGWSYCGRAYSWTAKDGMVELPSAGGQTAAAGVNSRGQVAGSTYAAGAAGAHATLWQPAPYHLSLTFTSETGSRTVVWDADLAADWIAVARGADGALASLDVNGPFGDEPTGNVTANFGKLSVGRLIAGSLTATRAGQRISVPKMVGVAYADRVEFPNRVTYYDGRNTLFGDLTLRVTANS